MQSGRSSKPCALRSHAALQDLDGLLVQFDAERAAMAARHNALESETARLRQQLSSAMLRASDLAADNEALLRSLEQHRGVMMHVRL